MRIEPGLTSERAEVETTTAARVENDVARARGDQFGDAVQQRRGHAAIVQSPACGHGGYGVAWIAGSPLLRLEQVDVTATRDVERVSARADEPPVLPLHRRMAVADGAEEHGPIVTAGRPRPRRKSRYRRSTKRTPHFYQL